MADDERIAETLHVAREVSIYRVPPRHGADGYRSGSWLTGDKIFSGRLRVVGLGDVCEIRVEDASSGDLFAMCAVPYGKRGICVEACSDSSRYFVLRVEDPSTKRHAFLGLGFDVRTDAFDFNEALISHEKHVEREKAAASIMAGGSSGFGMTGQAAQTSGPISDVVKEMQSLYAHHGEMGLKEGQTIRVNLKKGDSPSPTPVGTSRAIPLVPLAPPPSPAQLKPLTTSIPLFPSTSPAFSTSGPPLSINNPQSGASSSGVSVLRQTQGPVASGIDLLSDPFTSMAQASSFDPFGDFNTGNQQPVFAAPKANITPSPAVIDSMQSWASFD